MLRKDGRLRLWPLIPTALIVPIGYFLFELALYGMSAALPNVPLNLLQSTAGACIAYTVIHVLQRRVPWVRTLQTAVTTKPEGTFEILREPKGGPDAILIGRHADQIRMKEIGNILSVQGYTARIVAIEAKSLKQTDQNKDRDWLTEGVPYISLLEQDGQNGLTAQQIASQLLERIHA